MLIVILIGFTVLQQAIAGGGMASGVISDTERKALALTGSGDVVFDWDVVSDKVHVSPGARNLAWPVTWLPRRPGRALA